MHWQSQWHPNSVSNLTDHARWPLTTARGSPTAPPEGGTPAGLALDGGELRLHRLEDGGLGGVDFFAGEGAVGGAVRETDHVRLLPNGDLLAAVLVDKTDRFQCRAGGGLH